MQWVAFIIAQVRAAVACRRVNASMILYFGPSYKESGGVTTDVAKSFVGMVWPTLKA